MVVKTISVILLFLLVKSKEDILWYGAYSVLGVLGGNIFNFVRLRKYLHKDMIEFRALHPFSHLNRLYIFLLLMSLLVFIFN